MAATLSEIEQGQIEAFSKAIPPLLKLDKEKFTLDINHLNKAALHDAMVPNNGAECFLSDELAERIRYLETEDRSKFAKIAIEDNKYRWC